MHLPEWWSNRPPGSPCVYFVGSPKSENSIEWARHGIAVGLYTGKAPKCLSHIGQASKSQFHRPNGPQPASPIQERPQNSTLIGETGLKQPLLFGKGPKIPISQLRRASTSLCYIGKASEPNLAGEDCLKQPVVYGKCTKVTVSPARLASNPSPICIGKAPKSQSRREDSPRTACPIWKRPQTLSPI